MTLPLVAPAPPGTVGGECVGKGPTGFGGTLLADLVQALSSG